MTNYARGRALEYRAKAWLMEGGAFVVRAAGSKGSVDLVAHWPIGDECPKPWFVQCKRDGKLPKKERAALAALARLYGAEAFLCKPFKRKLLWEAL